MSENDNTPPKEEISPTSDQKAPPPKEPIDSKVVFAIGNDANGSLSLIIGMPDPAYAKMKDGLTNTISLHNYGIPINVVIFNEETHDKCMDILKKHFQTQGKPYLDERHKNNGIGEPLNPPGKGMN